MRIVVVNNGTTHSKKLEKLLSAHDVTTIAMEDFRSHQVPIGVTVVLSGAGKGRAPVLGFDEYYQEQLDLILKHDGPIIGICLGLQLIAHAYGAPIYERKRRIHRLVSVKRSASSLAEFLPEQSLVYVAHRYAVKDINHTPIVALGWSRGGIEILRHKTKPIYGVQFHPEVRLSSNGGKRIFESILNELHHELE